MKNKINISTDLKQLTKDIQAKRSSILKMHTELKLDKLKNVRLLSQERKNLAKMLTVLNQKITEGIK